MKKEEKKENKGRGGSQETAVTKTKLWCFKKNLKSRNDGLQSPFWQRLHAAYLRALQSPSWSEEDKMETPMAVPRTVTKNCLVFGELPKRSDNCRGSHRDITVVISQFF